MIKLIASDLDDTLLNEDSRLSAENKKAVEKVLHEGLTFTFATGRMFQSAAPFARELDLQPEQPIICYNGALIKRLSGEILYEKPLDPDISKMIVEYGQRRGWTINIYYDDELYVADINEQVRDYTVLAQVNATPVGDLVRFIEDGAKPLSKVLIISDPEETAGRMEELKPLVGSQVQMVRSRDKFIEITNLEAHKGAALLWLASSMGLAVSEVMALGDSNNDLTMLKMAGTGIAMANASDIVKGAADFETDYNYEHGVAKALARFVLDSKS